MNTQFLTKYRNTKPFALITYILILAFILTLNGCYTTSTGNIPGNKMPKNSEKIVKVKMNNGSVINLEDKEVQYFPVYKEYNNVLVYEESRDTTFSKDRAYFNTSTDITIIELDDAAYVTIEKTEINTGTTILLVLGTAALVFLILLGIGLSQTKNIIKLN